MTLARTPSRPCEFCGEQAEVRCDYQGETIQLAAVEDLHLRDVVYNSTKTRRGTLVGVTKTTSVLGVRYSLLIEYKLHGRRVFKESYVLRPDYRIHVERDGTCLKACCYRHFRELSEESHLCSDHWRTQLEQVA